MRTIKTTAGVILTTPAIFTESLEEFPPSIFDTDQVGAISGVLTTW
jgi:hypothetical protein